MQQRELDSTPKNPDVLRQVLQGLNYVYEGCFPLRTDGVSDEVLKRAVYKRLRSRGIKDPSVITPCSTKEEQLTEMIKRLALLSLEPGNSKKPWVIVADDDTDMLKDALSKLPGKNSEILRKNITILQPNASLLEDRVDSVTGIRVLKLPAGVANFPEYPAP